MVSNRAQFSVQIDAALVEKVRDAAFWTPGLTMADIVEDGVRRALVALEKKNGGPFPPRKGKVRTGRPVKQ
jgi:hypothetical protein